MSKKDYYSTLGIAKTASPEEIKKAYRGLAIKYHPDKNPDNKQAEEKFKEAAEAYQVLSDTQKKARYDQYGHAGVDGNAAHNHGGMNMDDIFSNFGDIFENLFGGGGRSSRSKTPSEPHAQQGHDLKKDVSISLKESFTGTETNLSYIRYIVCQDCKGKGAAPGTSVSVCKDCKGQGQVHYQQGFFAFAQPCPSCKGQGFTIPSACSGCKGQTRTQKRDSFSVNIPKGIVSGMEIRLSHKGDAGIFGGGSGDLYVQVLVQEDKKFKRRNDDLTCQMMLTYPQLVFGCQVEIESIDGTKETVKISAGTPADQLVTLAGKGFISIRTKVRGNLIVKLKCHIPKKIDAQSTEILKKYSESIGTDLTPSDDGIIGFFKKFLG